MEESGQPRVIWDHEHAVMASASSNLATQTILHCYFLMILGSGQILGLDIQKSLVRDNLRYYFFVAKKRYMV